MKFNYTLIYLLVVLKEIYLFHQKLEISFSRLCF